MIKKVAHFPTRLKFYRRAFWCFAGLAALLALVGCSNDTNTVHWSAVDSKKTVLANYADIAYTSFLDSYDTALKLKEAIDVFVASPSPDTHEVTKRAWVAARIPYGQTEVFRFGNENVDEWEGKVNAWPLDEGLIDYVEPNYEFEEGNQFAQANIIAGTEPITPELLRSHHEKAGFEANVATGYHAIEFLLWGQDLNRKTTDAGMRGYTDYVQGDGCTNANCERRVQYLRVATQLLVDDLKEMVDDWAPDGGPSGENYHSVLKGDPDEGIRKALFGMGSLSLGELANERLKVALVANSQEDEHS